MKEITTGIRKLMAKRAAKTGRLNFRIDEEDLALLVKAAGLEDVQPSEFVRRAIRERAAAVLAEAQKPEKPSRKKQS